MRVPLCQEYIIHKLLKMDFSLPRLKTIVVVFLRVISTFLLLWRVVYALKCVNELSTTFRGCSMMILETIFCEI